MGNVANYILEREKHFPDENKKKLLRYDTTFLKYFITKLEAKNFSN